MPTPIWNFNQPTMITVRSAELALGVNGHPATKNGVYGSNLNLSGVSLDTQIGFMKHLGANICRFDVGFMDTWNTGRTTGTADAFFNAGIRYLPVLQPVWHPYLTGAEIKAHPLTGNNGYYSGLYNSGYQYAATVATLIDKYTFKSTYELDNELDILSFTPGKDWTDGDASGDYRTGMALISYWIYKGLNDGIKSVVPNARTIVDVGYFGHLGWFRFLENPSWLHPSFSGLAPLNYDVVGWHPYFDGETLYSGYSSLKTPDKHILRALSRFGKPIWLTEFNKQYGSYPTGEKAQIEIMGRWLIDSFINGQYPIEGLLFYDLLDDIDSTSTSPEEKCFGMFYISGSGKMTIPWGVSGEKPVYEVTRRTFNLLRTIYPNTP